MVLPLGGFGERGADGRWRPGWRIWFLIWLLPGVFALGAAALAAEAWAIMRLPQTTGEVVRVYSWVGDSVLDHGEVGYAPVFRYVWTDGQPTEASTGLRHTDWNFPVGSQQTVLYRPDVKADVHLPGPHNWFEAQIIGIIAAILLVPSLWITLRLRAWVRRP